MDKRYGISLVLSAFTGFTASLQASEIMQLILMGLGIVSALVSIIMSVSAWYKNAKADGKITKEEIDELINNQTIKDNIERITGSIKSTVDKDNEPKEPKEPKED